MTTCNVSREVQNISRKVGSVDFERAVRLKRSQEERGLWWVCRGYRTDGDRIAALSPDPITFTGETFTVYEDGSDGWIYSPLVEEPELFLKFARLQKARDFRASALDFCHRYGIPGHVRRPDGAIESRGAEAGIGATQTTFSQIWEESRLAWAVLCLYEAAHEDDTQEIRGLLTQFEDVLGGWPLYYRGQAVESEDASFAATLAVARTVEEMVHLLCRLRLHVVPGRELTLGLKTVEGWTFSNLLGAMYLQMFWLVASGEDLARCEHCGLVMSLGHASPEGRKRRRDKRFCNDACRQAHHRRKNKP